MWLYLSRSGAVLNAKREKVATGFAGRRHGLNNPDAQHEKGIGPLPEGLYTMETPYDSQVTGPYTIRLVPHPSNQMHGRNSFAIHGVNAKNVPESSHGCICLEPARRELMWESGDRLVKVVAD